MIFINRKIKYGEEITQDNLELVELEHFLTIPNRVAVQVLDNGDIIVETNTQDEIFLQEALREMLSNRLIKIIAEENEEKEKIKILKKRRKAIEKVLGVE